MCRSVAGAWLKKEMSCLKGDLSELVEGRRLKDVARSMLSAKKKKKPYIWQSVAAGGSSTVETNPERVHGGVKRGRKIIG